MQAVHTRVWGHGEVAPAAVPAGQLTCALGSAQTAALRPNSGASRSPLQLQRPRLIRYLSIPEHTKVGQFEVRAGSGQGGEVDGACLDGD